MTNSYLETIRKREFGRDERDLYMHLGYFVTWYNHAEFCLTIIMAMVLRERDLAAFHQLTMGLDARSKIRRFRKICAIKKQPIGPNLDTRLTHFYDTICKFRDRASHTALARGETEEKFYFNSPDRMPWRELGMDPKAPPAASIEHIKVFEYGWFLHNFSDDLLKVNQKAIAGLPLEIDHPQSTLPQEHPSSSPAPDPQPKPDKPAQTDSETRG